MALKRDLGFGLLLAISAAAWAGSSPASGQAPASLPASLPASAVAPAALTSIAPDAARGKREYARYCVWCHGASGNGRGVSSHKLSPLPRDFTTGAYKCRSTPSGSLPTDEDLRAAIRRGLAMSGMPGWAALGSIPVDDLIAQIKHFSPRFGAEPVPPPLAVPGEPADGAASAARGKGVFGQMKCATCHGADGRGDGPAAPTLRDDLGNPIASADLTDPEGFKCGGSAARLYTTFMTGLDGTPMPSYAQILSPDQAWDLVHYLKTLAKESRR